MNINHHDNGVQIPASNIIYGYYIKKIILNKLVYAAFHNTPNAATNKIRIFIDITNIARSIMTSNCVIYDNYEVACTIINMIAHYKSFFMKGNYGVLPEFYLVHVNEFVGEIENKRNPYFYNDARTTIYSPMNSGKLSFLLQNIQMVKLITQYIPDVYFVDGNLICTPVMMYNIIKKYNDNVPNIVITKDPTANQLAIISNTMIFRPKKSKTGKLENPSNDISYIINSRYALLDSLMGESYTESTIDKINSVNPVLWSLIVASNGMKYTNLEKALDIRNTLKLFDPTLNNVGIPTVNTVDNLNIPMSISRTNDDRGIRRIMKRNFDSIDIPYKYSIYNTSAEAKLGIPPTLFDNNGLKQINDTYFNNRGLFIDLMSLL